MTQFTDVRKCGKSGNDSNSLLMVRPLSPFIPSAVEKLPFVLHSGGVDAGGTSRVVRVVAMMIVRRS